MTDQPHCGFGKQRAVLPLVGQKLGHVSGGLRCGIDIEIEHWIARRRPPRLFLILARTALKCGGYIAGPRVLCISSARPRSAIPYGESSERRPYIAESSAGFAWPA